MRTSQEKVWSTRVKGCVVCLRALVVTSPFPPSPHPPLLIPLSSILPSSLSPPSSPPAGGTENPDAEEELQRNAQASWTSRMFTSLVGESTLFNTREGRAGKVHNFMLGLNLNSSMPFSPFNNRSYTHHNLEEEQDAVTGLRSV